MTFILAEDELQAVALACVQGWCSAEWSVQISGSCDMQLTDHFSGYRELGIANNMVQIVVTANQVERSKAFLHLYRIKPVQC